MTAGAFNPLQPIIDLLGIVVCVLTALASFILAGIIFAVNALIVGIGAFLLALAALMPDMPDAPPNPDGGVLGTLNWIMPLSQLLGGLTIVLTLWLAFLGLRVALRWMKAM